MDEFDSLISLQGDIDYDSCSYPFHNQHIISTLPLQQQTCSSIEQDLLNIIPTPAPNFFGINELNNNNNNNQIKKGRKQRKPSSAVQEEDGNGSDPAANNQKRIVHRDIERLRRQEMASLYSSLRTLLPLEYIRGKRSICDQVNEAVNYIKYQEANIKQLQSKRDKLRTSLMEVNSSHDSADISSTKEGTSTKSFSPLEISIKSCSHGGIEILIYNEIVGKVPCPLSSVLQVLVEIGLTVVSCFCTKVRGKFLYTIETEATAINTDFYIHVLPQKLSEKIKAPINIKCSSSSSSS